MFISIITGAIIGFFVWQITTAKSPEKRHEWLAAGAIAMVFGLIVAGGVSIFNSLVDNSSETQKQATDEPQRVWVNIAEDGTWKSKEKAKWELEEVTATPTARPTKDPEQRPTKDPEQRPDAPVGGGRTVGDADPYVPINSIPTSTPQPTPTPEPKSTIKITASPWDPPARTTAP